MLTGIRQRSEKEEEDMQVLVWIIGGVAVALLIYYVYILMRGTKS